MMSSQQHQYPDAAEQVALGFLVVTAMTGPFCWLRRRRWQRGVSLAKPAVLFLVLWSIGVLWLFVPGIHREVGVSAFGLTIVFAMAGAATGVAAYAIWLCLLCVWECLVWLTHSDAELVRNRRGHWVTAEECRANKGALEEALRQAAPALAIDVLLAGAGDGWLLGADASTVYSMIAQPWVWWDQASRELTAGRRVWHDDLPGNSGFAQVVAPVVILGFAAWIVVAWVTAALNVHSGAGRAAVVVGGLGLFAIACRRRLRSGILTLRACVAGRAGESGPAPLA